MITEVMPGQKIKTDTGAPLERVPGEHLPVERVPGERVPLERIPGERVPSERPVGERPASNLPWEKSRRKPKRLWQRLIWPAIWTAIAVTAYYTVPKEKVLDWWKSKTTTPVTKAAPRPIPVLTAATRRGDMDLYLNGLGSVTALYTVTLKTRVDGQLIRVNYSEGQMVKEGDLIAEIDPRPFYVMLKQAEGNLIRDQASLKVAQLDLDRYNALIGSKSITQQQLDAQLALVKQSEGAIKTDQAAIDNAKLQLFYCKITAPISGRIGLRIVDPGNMVHTSDFGGLAVITQLQPITVVFTIPQDDISRVQKRINAGDTLMVDAYDRDFKTKLATGRLKALDNQVDTTTGTVRIKAEFPNEDNMLFPNQFVNARLLVSVERDAVIAPSAAVQRGPDSTFVYVVKPDQTVELKTVTTGPSEGDEIVIESGLEPAEAVVVDGVDKLQPGTKVDARDRSSIKSKASRQPADDQTRPKGRAA